MQITWEVVILSNLDLPTTVDHLKSVYFNRLIRFPHMTLPQATSLVHMH